MDIDVIRPDGTSGTPTSQDTALLAQAQKLIEADGRFKALKSPVLHRAEVNAGLAVTDQGYLYLCYQVQDAVPQEFWAHLGTSDKVSWHSGQVCVAQEGAVFTPKP